MMMKNPFLTYGYNGAEYFCDREQETKRLTSLLINGNHVALISPRRMGKTGLIRHCFAQQVDYKLHIQRRVTICSTLLYRLLAECHQHNQHFRW